MLIVSLLLNIAVLVPVSLVLIRQGRPATYAWGGRTAGRDILLAIYLSILFVSCSLLAGVAAAGATPLLETAAASLLIVQIIYKVLTVITVRHSLRNPVVLSNLGIAAVHAVTVATLAPALLA
ncbi:hypothetical protein BJG92_01180 [Arthrobacter sp. SO5]|uniref:hypothetical protein n=1 Tax=Arthrobacter sp. SO5 TaxID=1897055 RepID=UPI001E425B4D|nr:hypothetical protein [Arthrobacter sp. SO5]MCB5273656.1 hypothetical protein [Arthrobacter sp. SO5]